MASIQEIERHIALREAAIRAAQSELEALYKVRSMLLRGEEEAQMPLLPRPEKPLPREGSAVRFALDVLAKSGRPMKMEDLYAAVVDSGIKISQESFYSGLYRAKNEGRWFVKTGRGEFGLREWGAENKASPQSRVAGQPMG